MQATHVQAGAAPGARWTRLQRLSFVLCALPTLWLAFAATMGMLGANPLESLLRVSGRTALLQLLATLAVGPLLQLGSRLAQLAQARYGRRLSDWNALIALRRQLGLFACFHAVLHTALYLSLDAGLDWRAVLQDVQEQRYLLPGWIALLCLLPLAATSNAAARRALGAYWQRLHLLGYVVALATLLHQSLQAKVALLLPWPELLALALLLGWRVRESLRGRHELHDEVRLRLRRWRGLGGPGN